jgi:hypothetical protein
MGFLFAVAWPRRQRMLRFGSCGLWQEEMKGTTHYHPVSMLGMCGTIYKLLFLVHIFELQVSTKWIKSDLPFCKNTQNMI